MAKWSDEIEGQRLHPESLMMSYGYNPKWSEGAAVSPIYQTSTFEFENAAAGKRAFQLAYGLEEAGAEEEGGCLIYSRINNPDLQIAEERIALWDGAEEGVLFESGMAAITTTLWSYLRPGDVLLASAPLYGGTHHFIETILPQFGVEVIRFDLNTPAEEISARVDQADGQLGLILLETPANPTNDLVDMAECVRFAAEHSTAERKVPVAVDNTFLGPVFQSPIEHGVDIVLYSATKYLGGHSDLIAGAATGSAEVLAPIKEMRTMLGTMTSPFVGWLLLRSLKTLRIRMDKQAENARVVADYLRDHAKVKRVNWLGHINEGHPNWELYQRQCKGPGAMVAVELEGGELEAYRFLDALGLIKLAVSLGAVESLAEHPATMTHSSASAEEKEAFGITDSLVRLSVGIEHADDLLLDLERALKAV
jgi:methionine-gamma-lyase